MKRLKTSSIAALLASVVLMIWGIGVVTYYVDDLFVRGLSIGILILSSALVSNTVKLVYKETK